MHDFLLSLKKIFHQEQPRNSERRVVNGKENKKGQEISLHMSYDLITFSGSLNISVDFILLEDSIIIVLNETRKLEQFHENG